MASENHDGMIIFIICIVVVFFLLFESKNIAGNLGAAIANYQAQVAPAATNTATITIPLSTIIQSAAQIAPTQVSSASTNNTTTSTSVG